MGLLEVDSCVHLSPMSRKQSWETRHVWKKTKVSSVGLSQISLKPLFHLWLVLENWNRFYRVVEKLALLRL